MNCPKCSHLYSKVVDKRNNKECNSVRRRRECLACGNRYTTYEKLENVNFLVRKKSGRMEEYERTKLKNSVLKGLKKRSVPETEIENMLDHVELALKDKHRGIIDSVEIGNAVLAELKKLDKVAYMLYATVYRDFNTLEDIKLEIDKLVI